MSIQALLRAALQPRPANVATGVFVLAVLGFAYLVYPSRLVQYGAWLVVFTVWMAWFVYTGVEYVYGVES